MEEIQQEIFNIATTQNMNDLQITSNTQQTQISGIIFDALGKQKIHDYYHLLCYFRTLLLLDKLGDYEHTSDWDPYLEFHFKDGTSFSTLNGYWIPEEIGLKSILIEGPAPDDWKDANLDERFYSKEEQLYYIPTEDIEHITLHR
jgi:hypothetical protein